MSDAGDRYEIEKILKRRLDNNGDVSDTKNYLQILVYFNSTHFQFEYLMKWKGYRTPTWEPREYVDGCDETLQHFEWKQMKRVISKFTENCCTICCENILI